MKSRQEQGVALLSVLLLVAVMSVMAVTVLDEIRFGVRRAANAEAVGQARWHALGAEALARSQASVLIRSQARLIGWSGRVVSYPVDGAAIRARISDGAACFNLNSVVQPPLEAPRRRDEGAAQFVHLAEAVGIAPREAEALAAALVDWIDADPLREPGGAEDDAYDGYRTAGALLAERSELRAIRGFTPELYVRLRPYVCALPTTDLAPINPNTLTESQAPLLVMLTEGRMPAAAARRLIAARPVEGWTAQAFMGLPAVVEAGLSAAAVDQIRDTVRFFRLETEVALGDGEVVSSALLEADAAGRVRLAARRWGLEE